jgi:hypothetical protein
MYQKRVQNEEYYTHIRVLYYHYTNNVNRVRGTR